MNGPLFKGPLFALAASLVALMASTEVASAQPRVIIEQFNGPEAKRVRLGVIGGLRDAGLTVVKDKDVQVVEAELGLIKVSDSYAAVARELKIDGFIGGTVISGGRKARVVVRGPNGRVLGHQIFSGPNVKVVAAKVNGNIGKVVGSILRSKGGGAPAAAPAEEPVAMAEEPMAAGDDEEATPADMGGDEADAELADEAELEEEEPGGAMAAQAGTGLNVAFVLRMFSRNFAYNQSVRGNQQEYQVPEEKFNNLPLVPAPGVALEYFATPWLAVNGAFNYAIAAAKDNNDSVYKTKAFSWSVGAKGRLAVSSLFIEPELAYGSQVFEIENFADDPNRIRVAPVDYRHVRVGGGVRMPLSGGSSFAAGANYLHILSAGDILNEDEYFSGSALGGEVFVNYAMPLSFMDGLDLRLGADLRRIVFAFSPDTGDERIAGGAVDQYIGLNIGLGYSL